MGSIVKVYFYLCVPGYFFQMTWLFLCVSQSICMVSLNVFRLRKGQWETGSNCHRPTPTDDVTFHLIRWQRLRILPSLLALLNSHDFFQIVVSSVGHDPRAKFSLSCVFQFRVFFFADAKSIFLSLQCSKAIRLNAEDEVVDDCFIQCTIHVVQYVHTSDCLKVLNKFDLVPI